MADYLPLLRELSALDPPLFVFGSVAEAALLDGELDASHGDVDVLIPRRELELRLQQLGELGFADFTVYYEPRPGLPLVYGSARDELALELTLLDIDRAGHPYFVVTSEDGPTSISVPPDLFQRAPTIIDGVPVHSSALSRLFTSARGRPQRVHSGPRRPEKDGTRHSRLVDVFLSNVYPAQLEPAITPISGSQ